MASEWRNKTRYVPYPSPQEVGKMYIRSGATYVLATTYRDPPTSAPVTLERQSTWSMGHRGPPYLEGGPFSSVTLTDRGHEKYGQYTLYSRDPSRLYKYEGGFTCGCSLDGQPIGFILNPNDLDASYSRGDPSPYGASGWNRYRPGQNLAALAQALAEVRDLPRTIQTTARGFRDLWRSHKGMSPKALSDHWLNHQFGWLPFVNDVCSMVSAYRKYDRLIREARANNGQTIRRGGTVSVREDEQLLSGSDEQTRHSPSLNVYFYPGSLSKNAGTYRIYRKDSVRVWFVGAFKYYVPDIRSVEFEQRFIRRLYGLNLNPELLWELTPWSWLIDWFTNAGDAFSNVDTGWADNLVATYAYVMETRHSYIQCDSTLNTVNNGTLSHSWTYDWVSKGRAQANPYGFGITWEGLSPKQLSILAALGITRS